MLLCHGMPCAWHGCMEHMSTPDTQSLRAAAPRHLRHVCRRAAASRRLRARARCTHATASHACACAASMIRLTFLDVSGQTDQATMASSLHALFFQAFRLIGRHAIVGDKVRLLDCRATAAAAIVDAAVLDPDCSAAVQKCALERWEETIIFCCGI